MLAAVPRRASTSSAIRAGACSARAPASPRTGPRSSPRRRRLGVAIEIDGDPARQDVDYDLAPAAARAGCLFALDTDAHAVSQWRYAETAIAHARLAGIDAAASSTPGRCRSSWSGSMGR